MQGHSVYQLSEATGVEGKEPGLLEVLGMSWRNPGPHALKG